MFRSWRPLADKAVKIYRCSWERCLMQLLYLRSSLSTKLAKLVSPYEASSVNNVCVKAFITTPICTVHEADDARSDKPHIVAKYHLAPTWLSGSTTSSEVWGRTLCRAGRYVRRWDHGTWSLLHGSRFSAIWDKQIYRYCSWCSL